MQLFTWEALFGGITLHVCLLRLTVLCLKSVFVSCGLFLLLFNVAFLLKYGVALHDVFFSVGLTSLLLLM